MRARSARIAIILATTAMLIAVIYARSTMSAITYTYNPNQTAAGRPYPVEMLLEVQGIADIDERSAGPKSASVIVHEYKRRIDAFDVRKKYQVQIRLTERDFNTIEPLQKGDKVAVFGIEPSRKMVHGLKV
jgi:hypothetical protein